MTDTNKVEPVATLWREKNQQLYPGPRWKLTPAGASLPLGVEHPLVPASALAAEQAKVRELVEVLQMMVFMVKREAPILAGKAVGHADAIIAKYGEQK